MKITRAIRVSHLGDDKLMTTLLGDMLTVTIDQSEGISGADIPEQAVKKNAYRLLRPVSPQPSRVFRISY